LITLCQTTKQEKATGIDLLIVKNGKKVGKKPSVRKMKRKKKLPKPASMEKIQRLRDGIRERSTTWSKFKTKTRHQQKRDLLDE